jgi:Baseplate J-like protein
VSFTGRDYPAIVADLLTNLTHGVTGELHPVEYVGTGREAVARDIHLKHRPVHRVSRVTGRTATEEGAAPALVEFTLNDYEVIPNPEDPEDGHVIRFLPGAARRPAPGSEIHVNYYPRTTEKKLLTDVQPGSVVRTLLETVARELAVLYAQLDAAYDSAFLETATGSSLDRVVALLGYRRYRAGRPVGSVRFGRRRGTPGDVTIPAGTPVTNAEDTIRYETVETRTMLSGESVAEVRVRGATDATPVAEPGVLEVIQRSIAGIDTVTNERATTTSSGDETDVELRSRARVALLAASKGTIESIEFGLLQLPGVRSVRLEEAPNGVPGEIRVAVSLDAGDGSTLPPEVLERLEQLRPAGVRVIAEASGTLNATANVELVVAGAGIPEPDLRSLQGWAASTIVAAVKAVAVGEPVRVGRLVAALLSDQRIADVRIRLGERGKRAGEVGVDLVPPNDRSVRLDAADVTFGAAAAERPAAATGAPVPVDVRATIPANPIGGTDPEAIRSAVTERLNAYLRALRPDATITAGTILEALRDDASYAIDPLRLRVTFTAGDQFVQVATGGQSFRVRAAHRLTLGPVEVVR